MLVHPFNTSMFFLLFPTSSFETPSLIEANIYPPNTFPH